MAFFTFSLSFLFTFFSLFLLVRFSRSAASFSATLILSAASLTFNRATFLRRMIRRFLPTLFLLLDSLLGIVDDIGTFPLLGTLMVTTLQGSSHPG